MLQQCSAEQTIVAVLWIYIWHALVPAPAYSSDRLIVQGAVPCTRDCNGLQALLDLLRIGAPVSGRGTHPPSAATTAAQQQGSMPAQTQLLSSSSAHAEKGDTVVLQQLAHLKGSALSAVRLLAGQVGTAAEVCEALTGALTAAGAELGLASGSQVEGVRPAAVTPLVKWLSTAGTTRAADRGPFVSGGGYAAVDSQTAEQAVDVTKGAAAAMVLQCAAAATDAFLQQCRLPQSSSTGSSAGHSRLVLPGGVLPGNLVAAALPLLRASSADIRRPVQHMLLEMLPLASKASVSGIAALCSQWFHCQQQHHHCC